jgi:hypothetical protein
MGANYVLLENLRVSSEVATVVFNNIPQTGYTDLVIKISGRTVRTEVQDGCYMVANGINSTGFRNIEGNGTSASSVASASYGVNWVAYMPGGNSSSSAFGNAEIYIAQYNESVHKSITADSIMENADTTLSYMAQTAALWSNTASITELSFGCNANWAIGSEFSLYGVAAVGTTPEILPFATGGDIVANDGTYWYHAFLTSGTFTPQKTLSCDVVAVAGGGGGGGGTFTNGNGGGGGGAGGLVNFTSQSLTAIPNTVLVGAGGGGGFNGSVQAAGFNGTNSQFASLTAAVGGGGGGAEAFFNNGANGRGSNGGSGGGNSQNQSVAEGTTGQGNNGGQNTTSSAGSGGGGAGAVGGNTNGSTPGDGGAGVNTYSSWLSATGTGVSGFIAGGGGGGKYNSGAGGAGGSGGGGTGASSENSNNTAGTANTGGGGGGASNTNTPRFGRAGGSGIVIVRYPMV